jgi:hypothetical protein
MKKLMLILSLATGLCALNAAGVPTPAETALALRVSRDTLAKLPNKTAADRAAILAAREVWDTDNAAAVANLLPQIDAIFSEDAASGAFLIRYTLNTRNTPPGTTRVVTPFKRDAADLALAAKLKDVTAGASNVYYIRFYATPEEIALLPGSRSAAIAEAVKSRSVQLETPAIADAYFSKCLGLGLLQRAYNTWFDAKVTALVAAGKDAEVARLAKTESVALNGTKEGKTPAQIVPIDARMVILRAHAKLSNE